MLLSHYVGLMHRSECELARAFREVAEAHGDEADVASECEKLAAQCEQHAHALQPIVDRYGEAEETEPERLHSDLFSGTRQGSLGLLRDLHDLYLMATECDLCWVLLKQAGSGARDQELLAVVEQCESQTSTQLLWLKSRAKAAAPQTLVVAS